MVLSFRMVPSTASSMVLSMLGRQDLLLLGSSIPSTRNGIHYVNWGYVERMGWRAQWYLSCLREGGGTLEEGQQKGSSSLPLPLTALKTWGNRGPIALAPCSARVSQVSNWDVWVALADSREGWKGPGKVSTLGSVYYVSPEDDALTKAWMTRLQEGHQRCSEKGTASSAVVAPWRVRADGSGTHGTQITGQQRGSLHTPTQAVEARGQHLSTDGWQGDCCSQEAMTFKEQSRWLNRICEILSCILLGCISSLAYEYDQKEVRIINRR